MKCEKCGKELEFIDVNTFSRDGSDYEIGHTYTEFPYGAVVIDTTNDWTGYELTENEQVETIRCPYCHEYPFENKEIQVYEFVRVVMFKKESEDYTMAENKMKEVAKLLGVEMGVPFKVKGFNYNPCVIKEYGLYDKDDCINIVILIGLLTGDYEIEQPILTKKEKSYLEGVLRPFKDRVIYIQKCNLEDNEYINVVLELYCDKCFNDNFSLPLFEQNHMYKGMELDKQYTIEELGLFEDE